MTEQQLRACMPRCPDVATWAPAIDSAMSVFDINTPARQAAFLAQIAHESGVCRSLEENLRYSAKRLCAVWPRRFPTLEAAMPYAGQPEKLANVVYANRLGNGDVESGDGWRFRGRGLMHGIEPRPLSRRKLLRSQVVNSKSCVRVEAETL